MLTTTDLILDAIAAIELQESGEQLSYHVAVKRCGVGRTTLCRRYVTRQPDVCYHEDASFSFSRSYLASERPTRQLTLIFGTTFPYDGVDTPYWRGTAALSIWQILAGASNKATLRRRTVPQSTHVLGKLEAACRAH
jgi:hypothetical protein